MSAMRCCTEEYGAMLYSLVVYNLVSLHDILSNILVLHTHNGTQAVNGFNEGVIAHLKFIPYDDADNSEDRGYSGTVLWLVVSTQ